MSKESVNHIDRKCIFRENFQDEASVRRNGGVPTGVVFENGVGKFNGGYVTVSKQLPKGIYSIRLKLNINNFSTYNHLFDFRNSSYLGTGDVYCAIGSGECYISTGGGNQYIDTVIESHAIVLNKNHEIIITGMAIEHLISYFKIGGRTDAVITFHGDIELFEIYEGTLTAQEVKNLYNNKTYRSPNLETDGRRVILDVSARSGVVSNRLSGDSYKELVDQDNWYKASYWSAGFINGFSQDGVTIHHDGSMAAGIIINNFTNIGSKYRVKISVQVFSGYVLGPRSIDTAVDQITTSGSYTYDFTATTSRVLYISSINAHCIITGISIKEVIPSVVSTDVSVVKEGSTSVMKFNSLTSKIDIGSYDTLIGDKSFIFWFTDKPTKDIGLSRYLLMNGKLYIIIARDYFSFTSDGFTTTINSANYSTTIRRPVLLIITRSSTGITNFYINGVLSGTVNQSSGTPVVGTQNIKLGYLNGSDGDFKGLMSDVRITDGILTPDEIAQIFSSEKNLYL